MTDNTAHVLFVYGGDPILFKNCTFKNNIYTGVIYHTYFRRYISDTFYLVDDSSSDLPNLTLEDCIVENATFIEFKSIYKNPVCCQKIGFRFVGEAFRLPNQNPYFVNRQIFNLPDKPKFLLA